VTSDELNLVCFSAVREEADAHHPSHITHHPSRSDAR
jgi:hypothetical protein